jgi:hypothetical protein
MSVSNLSGAPVYVRYKDHVLYRNLREPVEEAVERETVGWLTKQDKDIMLIEHDRTTSKAEIASGSGSGIILLKSCIIEIHELPLQKTLNCHLNSPQTTNKTEYALQTTKRKTLTNGQGATE